MTYAKSIQEPRTIGTKSQSLIVSSASTSFAYLGWGASIPTMHLTIDAAVSCGAGVSVPIPGFSFAFVSGGRYLIDGLMLVQVGDATEGVQLAIETTDSIALATIGGIAQLANTGTGTFCHGKGNGTYVGTMSGLPAKDTPYPVMIKGLVVSTKSTGHAVLRIKGETGSYAVKVLAGSVMVVTKI